MLIFVILVHDTVLASYNHFRWSQIFHEYISHATCKRKLKNICQPKCMYLAIKRLPLKRHPPLESHQYLLSSLGQKSCLRSQNLSNFTVLKPCKLQFSFTKNLGKSTAKKVQTGFGARKTALSSFKRQTGWIRLVQQCVKVLHWLTRKKKENKTKKKEFLKRQTIKNSTKGVRGSLPHPPYV